MIYAAGPYGVRDRVQISPTCLAAPCYVLVFPVLSYDRYAKLLLSLFRSDVPRPKVGNAAPAVSAVSAETVAEIRG